MNNALQRFHRYALGRIVWPLSILIGVIFAAAWQFAPDSLWARTLSPLTSAATVGGIFWFLERKIRTDLWRIVYPELDFEGTWRGGTQYVHLQIGASGEPSEFTPFEEPHDIRFKQDCLGVAVDYDESALVHGWNSTVATIVTDSNGRVGLRYAYMVDEYKQGVQRDKRLPPNSEGIEELFVVDSRVGHKPRRVTGKFRHTADGPRPRYSGTVAFERVVEETQSRWQSKLFRALVTKWLKPPAE